MVATKQVSETLEMAGSSVFLSIVSLQIDSRFVRPPLVHGFHQMMCGCNDCTPKKRTLCVLFGQVERETW